VFNDNEIRWLSCDLAVATGELNDNTVLILTSLNLDTGIKRVVYINTLSGVSSIEQVKIMKRLFYDFKCNLFPTIFLFFKDSYFFIPFLSSSGSIEFLLYLLYYSIYNLSKST
jgi:hypothetical protein